MIKVNFDVKMVIFIRIVLKLMAEGIDSQVIAPINYKNMN